MKTIKLTLSSFLAIAILAGCAGSPFSFTDARQVKVGMSEAELQKVMGRPYSVVSRDGHQMWIYSFATGMGNFRTVSFQTKDGKVSEVPVIPSSF